MANLRKRLAVVLSLVVAFLVVSLLCLSLYLKWTYIPSKLVGFQPTSFRAKADGKFFYSVGDSLMNSDEIDTHATTLFHGSIDNFLVSPDGSKIAIVSNKKLIVVGKEGPAPPRVVASVDSIYRTPKPIGRHFFRDDGFQWSRDSKSLFLIRDQYYESGGSQLYSKNGELWRYDLKTGRMRLVLKPFPAYTCSLGRNYSIYFSVPTEKGDLQLEYFDGNRVRRVGNPNARAIPADRLPGGPPFFSFSIFDYDRGVLPGKGVTITYDTNSKFETLRIRNKSYLTFSQGENIKGPFFCPETLRSVFLPGMRYFLINVPDCGNYSGELLIDTATGDYERLPPHTRVYLTLNTVTYPHYRITGEGMLAN